MQVTADDPRLWCALGDLTLREEHYETAWQRSGRRSTRAQRSLARSAQREKHHEKVLPWCSLPTNLYVSECPLCTEKHNHEKALPLCSLPTNLCLT